MKDWFKARNIWGAAIQTLSDAEAGRLMKALWQYTMTGEQQDISGAEKGIFALITMTLSLDDAENLTLSEKRAIAGSKGGSQRVANQANQANDFATPSNQANQAIASNKNKSKNKEEEKEKEKERENLFTRFWDEYPRHEAKQTARKAFDKLNPDENLLQLMIAAIARWKTTAQWQENGGQYIPHPATWLNQRRWEDEPPKPSVPAQKPVKPVVAQQYEQRDYSSNAQSMDDVLDMLRGGMR